MASTPKPIRKAIKRAKIRASSYLGVKILGRVKKIQGRSHVKGRREGKRVKGIVILDKNKFVKKPINANEVGRLAQHEFAHLAHDTLMAMHSKVANAVFSEAFATLLNAEF